MGPFDDVRAAVEAAIDESNTPGVAVGLLHDGEEHVAAYGVTSVDNPLDVTPGTLFQIGSITKTFTGTVAMALVERGSSSSTLRCAGTSRSWRWPTSPWRPRSPCVTS